MGDLPSFQAFVGDSFSGQDLARTAVGWLTGVPAPDTRRVDGDLAAHPFRRDHMAKNGFGHRRAADVAQANK